MIRIESPNRIYGGVAGMWIASASMALPDPPFFEFISDPNMGIHDISDISADGSTVVGMSQTLGVSDHQGFRWTLLGGFERLGYLPGSHLTIPYAVAEGVNADGSVVVGRCYMPNEDYEAFRWTPATGNVALGDLPGGFVASQAHGTNADGTVVVGVSRSSNGIEAFRWIEGQGMQGLGALTSRAFRSFADTVSADGSIVVGASDFNLNNDEHAFRWTQQAGMSDLGALAGTTRSGANDVSADGTTIVGWSGWGVDRRAVRWTQSGIEDLGLPPGATSARAMGVSADGSVIVGSFGSPVLSGGFIWRESKGIADLHQVLLALGLSQAQDWMIRATAVSDDGRTIVGIGEHVVTLEVSGWIAYLGDGCYPDCDQSTGVGVLDIFDFLCFQDSFVNGDPYACDCDTSTGSGVCDVFDFLCFQNAFVGGCP